METVKVDIQKLQLLNDRITQTIEALNQVRLSVHGIQHTTAQPSPWGTTPWTNPYTQIGYAQPFNVGFGAFGQPFTPTFGPQQGLTHSTYAPTYSPTVFGTPTLGVYGTPFTGTPFTGTPFTGTPFTGTPFTGGLTHTSYDPTWQMRTAQTFPFIGYPYAPGSIY
jgi:hypothetical protein